AEKALGIAERLAGNRGDGVDRGEIAAAISQSHNTIGAALARLGDFPQAIEHTERSVAEALDHSLFQEACRAYTNLGVLYSRLDPGKAIETSEAGLELAKKIGHLGFQSWIYANLAGAYCTFTGQCEDEGIAAAESAVSLDRQLGQMDHLAVPLVVLGQIYQCHGAPARAMSCYQEALVLAEQMGEPQLLFPCYDGLATLYLEMDDEAKAEEFLLKAESVCEKAGVDPSTLITLPFLC
ncbi:MAG: tetratricopeptide repeat protein, partial [Chloroflexota bacterium]